MAVALLAPAALPRPLHFCVGSYNCGSGADGDASCSALLSTSYNNSYVVAAAAAATAGFSGWGERVMKRFKRKEHEIRLRLGAWQDSCAIAEVFWRKVPKNARQKCRLSHVVVKAEAQYEDNFDDVDKHLLDYFTYKAVRTVLVQLHEMNPAQYAWLYNFVVANKPRDSRNFLRVLVKERLELGERVMVTRLHLFGKWVQVNSLNFLQNRIFHSCVWVEDFLNVYFTPSFTTICRFNPTEA
ncbi:hypothetical protein O6H91_16G050100 [Diphasiastrum complanatum]|uniref:Uncharacterized protein n=1 Tax=Diphasiastrum complanatum TaxID=34168 RepID=A0ACC2BC85_DIPCM|nr:hypothetical protein O6H91_Y477300 [Diphasiastrum complanatum]KAJ7527360.1 hypothetical protein O6H91_16G050100 [Diphasiastrum complanatum]